MSSSCLRWVFSISLLLAACEAPLPEPPPVQAHGTAGPTATGYKAVLIAATGTLPVWDNAVEAVAARLRVWGGIPANDIQRLSAAPAVVANGEARTATLNNVLDAIGSMKPGPGEGCFVFATSNGSQGGLKINGSEGGQTISGVFLTPFDLDRALAKGCGGAPTVVVISGCFTGIFARPPMNRANRVVLTAARADRQSFGCIPGVTYTNYDTCLLHGLDSGGTWPRAYVAIQHCVIASELPFVLTASDPQAWFGPAVADMTLPVAMRDAGTR
jgi:hypothetical protein